METNLYFGFHGNYFVEHVLFICLLIILGSDM